MSTQQQHASAPAQPWERQPGETEVAFQAFLLYRDTEGKRSAHKVAAQSHKDPSLMRRWKARWDWLGRAAAWDAELDREYRAEVLRERAKIGRRHAQTYGAMQQIAAQAFQTIAQNAAGMSPRDALEYSIKGLQGEAALYGLGEHDDDAIQAVRIFIDPNVLPPGAQLPELEP
jgi:hypothetical protein